ncbi:hypothetical protein FIU87_14555 [Bacillus sp. THAF10]|uniref:hypothetical protein n=1 Tax=Bacillus sp. THAF10 TaxID=2587848 RepID=UPI0012678D89|nr:hypothetical protein [Bacillus sp. THAF10]QFT89882.1 hypothetical protein FIU87_14555 [Bacillus sp. THAF10]
MNKQRKEIIIHEIDYWKKNRLLPEQYCEYLLALYTEGEGINKRTTRKKNILLNSFALLITMLVPITFLVIYFTEMPIFLQMLLLTFFLIISSLGYIVFRKEPYIVHIPVIVSALLLMIFSIIFLEKNTYSVAITFAVITLQALAWFVIGFWKKWYYLNIASIIAIIILIIKIILK